MLMPAFMKSICPYADAIKFIFDSTQYLASAITHVSNRMKEIPRFVNKFWHFSCLGLQPFLYVAIVLIQL